MAVAGHDDVHIDIGSDIVGVVEIESRMAVADSDADGGDAIANGVSVWGGVAKFLTEGIDDGDEATADAGSASAAVGLEDFTVDGEGTFAEFIEVGDCAERAADESLDFGGASVDFAGSFALFAGLGAAGEHIVFGGDPAFSGADEPGWDIIFEGGGAEDEGIAAAIEHAPAGVFGEVALNGDGTEGIHGRALGERVVEGWFEAGVGLGIDPA